MGAFLNFKPKYLNVIISTIFVLKINYLKNMSGGDIITPKQWYIPIVILSISLVGLFSGVLNDQGASYSTGSKIVQPPSQTSTVPLASEPKANAKVKSNALVVNAKCSCSLSRDYRMHDPSWVNYCPKCHRKGTLIFEKTGDCPEGMIRCTCCDADYCAVHGKEHINGHPAYLRAA